MESIKQFMSREIVMTDGPIKVTRMRTSDGYASITVQYGTNQITLVDTDGDAPGAYEQKARKLAEMIDHIVNDSCTIPALDK